MGHSSTPPQLPEIADEAGDTPRWVPLLGIILFVIGTSLVFVCHHGSSADESLDGQAEQVD